MTAFVFQRIQHHIVRQAVCFSEALIASGLLFEVQQATSFGSYPKTVRSALVDKPDGMADAVPCCLAGTSVKTDYVGKRAEPKRMVVILPYCEHVVNGSVIQLKPVIFPVEPVKSAAGQRTCP